MFLLSSVLIVKIPWDSCQYLFLQYGSSKLQCIFQTSWLWCTWSPHTRHIFKTSPTKCALEIFSCCKQSKISSIRFHTKSFRERWCHMYPKPGHYPAQNRSATTLQAGWSGGDWTKSVLSSCHYIPGHRRPCHMPACSAQSTQQSWGLQTLTVGITFCRWSFCMQWILSFYHSCHPRKFLPRSDNMNTAHFRQYFRYFRHLLIILRFRVGQRPFHFFQMSPN